jgi:hypothetical protein
MIKTIALNKLVPSTRNVRRVADALADAQLKADIEARGLLQNLVVTRVARPRGCFAVEAGGRRLRALQGLAADGKLEKGHEICCFVVEGDAADATEASCYPLKSSALEGAFQRADVKSPVTLFHHNGAFWDQRALFHAAFYPPGHMVNNEEELLWIGCRSVAGDQCELARHYVEHQVIPDLVKWITNLEALPEGSPIRRETQRFERDWSPPNVADLGE